jgi:hypothetical protein
VNAQAVRNAAAEVLYALLLNAFRCRMARETTGVVRERVAAESAQAMAMARAFGVVA